MYSTLSYLAIFLLFSLRGREKLKFNDLFLIVFLAILLFMIFMVQGGGGFNSPRQGQYLSMLSPDSIRYIFEATHFRFFFLTNELTGVYDDGYFVYEATPKFGLSVLLSPFAKVSSEPVFLYGVMLSFSLLLGIVKLRLLRCFAGDTNYFLLAAFVIVFFPTDFYWSLRLLRELISNDLLEISIILVFLIRRGSKAPKIDTLILFFAIILLLVWRSQLAILPCVLAFALLKLSPMARTAFLGLFFVIGHQVLSAAGMFIFRIILDEGSLFRILISSFTLISRNDWIIPFIISACFLALAASQNATSIRREYRRSVRLFLLALAIAGVFYLLSDADLQIRFLYPLFVFFKAVLILSLKPKTKECPRGNQVFEVKHP